MPITKFDAHVPSLCSVARARPSFFPFIFERAQSPIFYIKSLGPFRLGSIPWAVLLKLFFVSFHFLNVFRPFLGLVGPSAFFSCPSWASSSGPGASFAGPVVLKKWASN